MKYEYLVIADDDTVLGFRAAGLPGVAAATSQEVLQALKTARDRKVGVVILTQDAAALAREEVDQIRFGAALPMIVEIPGPKGPRAGRKTLSDIIRDAIGVRV
jgi:V/A-type H+-transporting ATPase subunit F